VDKQSSLLPAECCAVLVDDSSDIQPFMRTLLRTPELFIASPFPLPLEDLFTKHHLVATSHHEANKADQE
jgi:hypothetical protein